MCDPPDVTRDPCDRPDVYRAAYSYDREIGKQASRDRVGNARRTARPLRGSPDTATTIGLPDMPEAAERRSMRLQDGAAQPPPTTRAARRQLHGAETTAHDVRPHVALHIACVSHYLLCASRHTVSLAAGRSFGRLTPQRIEPMTNTPTDTLQANDQVYLYAGDRERDHEFSWSSCDCCGSNLGGTRHHVVGLNQQDPTLPTIEYMVCIDCFEEIAL